MSVIDKSVLSDSHVAVVTDSNSEYSYPYVSTYGGDYWILPKGNVHVNKKISFYMFYCHSFCRC